MTTERIETLRTQVFGLLGHDPIQTEVALSSHAAKAKFLPAFRLPSLSADEFFSEFIVEHVEAARQLAAGYMALVAADAEPADAEAPGLAALEAALAQHSQALEHGVNRELLDHALMLFLTHDEVARRYLHGTTPPLLARQCRDLAARSSAADARGEEPQYYGHSTPERENQLEWFRADPLQCEHHYHWHVVYPSMGTQDATKERQGELFIYMHTQMIARYDAERLAVGLDPVEIYLDFEAAVPVGHDPGTFVRAFDYDLREPGVKPRDVDLRGRKIAVAKMQAANTAWAASIDGGRFEQAGESAEINPDLLGHTIEASIGRFCDRHMHGNCDVNCFREYESRYYNYHNNGHVMLAFINPDSGKLGAMSTTSTATRDPIFWMWHKHIDRQSQLWQDSQPPNDFSDAPPVEVGPPQIFRRAMLEGVEEAELLAAAAAYGSASSSSSSLHTRMREAKVEYDGHLMSLEHLDHDAFSYLLRLNNTSDRRRKITLRIFMAPEARKHDRRAWIEMDKFVVELEPGIRQLLRRDVDSSVIRKPAIRDLQSYVRDYRPETTMPVAIGPNDDMPALERKLADNKKAHRFLVRVGKDTPQLRALAAAAVVAVHGGDVERARHALTRYHEALLGPSLQRAYCECGWPYHLLVPRGTVEGMNFVLLAMATDWNLDRVGDEGCCGSMSFCGAADRYPDKREMGYPFDRRFPEGLMDTLGRLSNVGMSGLVITTQPVSNS